MLLGRLFGAITMCCLYCGLLGQRANASDTGALPVSSPVPTERCNKAYFALPIKDQHGGIPDTGFSAYIRDHESIYTKYLQACFLRWERLQDYTQEFLGDIYGVI